MQKTTVQSNALIVNPFGTGTFQAGDVVPAIIRCSRDELDTTILIAGAYERVFEPLSNLAKKQGITLRYGDRNPDSALSHLKNASAHLSCFVGTDTLPPGDFISVPLAVSPKGETIYLVHRTDVPEKDLITALFALTANDEFAAGATALGYHVT